MRGGRRANRRESWFSFVGSNIGPLARAVKGSIMSRCCTARCDKVNMLPSWLETVGSLIGHTSTFPRRNAPGFCQTSPSRKSAQGMPGARCTRGLACEKQKHASKVTTGSPVDPAFPARWFYGFLRTLPGDRAFLSPSSVRCGKHRHQLDISVEISEPHDFAVRLSPHSSVEAQASIASRANTRDDDEASLFVSARQATQCI